MDDTQTYDDRARGVNQYGRPDQLELEYFQNQMEKALAGPHDTSGGTPQNGPKEISYQPMVDALNGPSHPMMNVPLSHLQHMAGTVSDFPYDKARYTVTGHEDWWDRVLSPQAKGAWSVRQSGSLPANVLPITPGLMGYMSGK